MIMAQLDEQDILDFLILIRNSESSIVGSADYRLCRQKIQCLIGASQIYGAEESVSLSLQPDTVDSQTALWGNDMTILVFVLMLCYTGLRAKLSDPLEALKEQ